MSYHAEAAADLEIISRSGKFNARDGAIVRKMITHLDRASVFKLPVNGIIFPKEIERGGPLIDTIKRYDAQLRLPYSEVILEFANVINEFDDQKTSFTKVACIASDLRGVGAMQDFAREELSVSGMRGDEGIFVSGAFFIPAVGWIPNGHSMVWNDDGLFAIPNFRESPDSFDIAANDLQAELEAVTMIICALSCSNVSIQSEPAPEKVNKKRLQAKKRVIRDHHILVIGASKSERGEQLGGTHASPRVHLRRGHIRRLDKKNIWVNACVVGNKRMGILTKDYDIRERA